MHASATQRQIKTEQNEPKQGKVFFKCSSGQTVPFPTVKNVTVECENTFAASPLVCVDASRPHS